MLGLCTAQLYDPSARCCDAGRAAAPPRALRSDGFTHERDRFRAILGELIDENLFAIRAVLRILGVEHRRVPTLATCEERPRFSSTSSSSASTAAPMGGRALPATSSCTSCCVTPRSASASLARGTWRSTR
jgi:hypothetical protein